MDGFTKALYAILGATNAVFTMFVPIAVALVVITYFGVSGWQGITLMIAALLSTIYRAIRIGFSA